MSKKLQLFLSKFLSTSGQSLSKWGYPFIEVQHLKSTDWGQDLFRELWDHSLVLQDSIKFLEGLIMFSYSKCLPHVSRCIAGQSCSKLLSFSNSWEKFKIFLPSFLRYFDWKSCILLCKQILCSKDKFSFEYWHVF